MKYFSKLIAAAILLGLFISGLAQADLIVKSGNYRLNDHLYWLKTQDSFTIDQVASLPIDRFELPLGRDFGDGYDSSHYWFRFKFDFSQAKDDKWLLEIPFSLLDEVILFEPLKNGGFNKIVTGDRRQFIKRPTPLHQFVFPLDVHSDLQTYFLYIKTQDSIQVPLELWAESDYLPHYGAHLSIQMAFFGAMLVMILFNLFLYISTRDHNYIYYVAFISFMVLFQMGLQGFSHQFLWPNYPWWSNISTPLFGVLSLFFGLLFVRKLLNTKEHIPRFDRLLTIVSYTMIFSIWLVLFGDYDISIYASLITTSIFFNLALVAIILLVIKGNRTAKIVLVAWSVFLISGTISMLGILGVLPLEIANIHTLQIGSTVEVVLLSLALADRIKILRQEKLDIEIMSSDILRLSNEQLEKSNHIKDAFIATISHEIKTPMNAILGSSQLLKEADLTTDQSQFVDIIERSGNSLLNTLDNILEYSKLEAGKVVTIDREANTISLFEEISQLFELKLRKQPIRFWLTYADNVPSKIYIDDVLLKHVVMNLLSNSIKFTHQGFIWLHVSMSKKNRLKIEVSDSGIGMNQEQMDRVFGAFVQASDTTSRYYGGTGLGLVITKRICELLNGTVTVSSSEGEGSTFTVDISLMPLSSGIVSQLLPIKFCVNDIYESSFIASRFHLINKETAYQFSIDKDGNALVSSDKASLSIKGVLSRKSLFNAYELLAHEKNEKTVISSEVKEATLKHVLAVDDDKTNRMIIGKILERFDVTYQIVESGEKAIEAISNSEFDIILMDIEMPGMDGYETTKVIRNSEKANNKDPLKVVALSAHTANEFKQKARLSGMNDFLSKPVKITELKMLIESC
jgi:signal transduction histidine kinase/CheY-like chemotaxis protein